MRFAKFTFLKQNAMTEHADLETPFWKRIRIIPLDPPEEYKHIIPKSEIDVRRIRG